LAKMALLTQMPPPKVFSLFREFDDQPSEDPKSDEAVCNTGLGICHRLPITFQEVLQNWWKTEDSEREFTDIFGVRLTWENIKWLLTKPRLDIDGLPDGAIFEPGTEKQHLELEPIRLHPSSRLRLLGLAALRFPVAFESFVEEIQESKRGSRG
jgi:hypothetical protein